MDVIYSVVNYPLFNITLNFYENNKKLENK